MKSEDAKIIPLAGLGETKSEESGFRRRVDNEAIQGSPSTNNRDKLVWLTAQTATFQSVFRNYIRLWWLQLSRGMSGPERGLFSTVETCVWWRSLTKVIQNLQMSWSCCATGSCCIVAATHNYTYSSRWVTGCKNEKADALSRFQLAKFRSLAPDVQDTPCQIPCAIMYSWMTQGHITLNVHWGQELEMLREWKLSILFAKWTMRHQFSPLLGCQETNFWYILWYCASSLGLAYVTIKTYFAGIRNFYIERGLGNPFLDFKGLLMLQLELILKGISKQQRPKSNKRFPITASVLKGDRIGQSGQSSILDWPAKMWLSAMDQQFVTNGWVHCYKTKKVIHQLNKGHHMAAKDNWLQSTESHWENFRCALDWSGFLWSWLWGSWHWICSVLLTGC